MLTPRIKTPQGLGKTHQLEYRAWNGMLLRCHNPKNNGFANYGGRGIKVCKRWFLFANFLKDMGTRPSPGHSLDRGDNNRGYSKQNCRWATRSEQQSNRRNTAFVEYKGVMCSLADIARQSTLPTRLVYSRLYGSPMSVEDALTKPNAGRRRHKIKD